MGHKLPETQESSHYQRYHIETKPVPDIAPYPNRFRVKVKKHRLTLMLLKEFFHYRGNKQVITSRPCVYGVFSGPIGGFAPREHLCVGCLRCTTEFPDVVQIYRSPAREGLGDSYFTPELVDTVHYEAQTGRIPVKGAGYRGKFGGEGWDSMWTDMSEIVRPTRDGIHGREFISTAVDIGSKPPFLTFDEQGVPLAPQPTCFSIPLPILFDIPPASVVSQTLLTILDSAAQECETLAVMPLSAMIRFRFVGNHLIPLISLAEGDTLPNLSFQPRMIQMDEWDEDLYNQIRLRFPQSILCLRLNYVPQLQEKLLHYYSCGIRVFHLVADYHGRGRDGRFVLDLIREAHQTFVNAKCRDEVTLLGSGGVIAAEHVPKAIICGLDAVALDTALLVALQAKFFGNCVNAETGRFQLPNRMNVEWGVKRLKNLLASWRDQMLEVIGAMGMREVRRLRGEIGRAMFQKKLEREAFGEIAGYADKS